MAHPSEGVILFQAEHDTVPPQLRWVAVTAGLLRWRNRLFGEGLIGRDPARYEGAGYGNASARLDSGFLVTGTQTGGIPTLGQDGLCKVDAWFPDENRVVSHGPVPPSSEAMSHGAVYEVRPEVRFVFHVHAPDVWRARDRLGLPTTDPAAGYGTPELSRAVRDLAAGHPAPAVLAMGGHEDGLLAYGRTADEAGQALLDALAAAR